MYRRPRCRRRRWRALRRGGNAVDNERRVRLASVPPWISIRSAPLLIAVTIVVILRVFTSDPMDGPEREAANSVDVRRWHYLSVFISRAYLRSFHRSPRLMRRNAHRSLNKRENVAETHHTWSTPFPFPFLFFIETIRVVEDCLKIQ